MLSSPKSTHFSPSSPRNDESSSEKTLSPLTSPHACPQTASRGRPLEEIIGETFPPFDHQSAVVGPFQDETTRDLTFEQGKFMSPSHTHRCWISSSNLRIWDAIEKTRIYSSFHDLMSLTCLYSTNASNPVNRTQRNAPRCYPRMSCMVIRPPQT